MYGQTSITSFRARSLIKLRGPGTWLTALRLRRRVARELELETIERLERIERERRRSGAHVPDRSLHRRWC